MATKGKEDPGPLLQVGTKVSKYFKGDYDDSTGESYDGWFTGTITSIHKVSNRTFYRIEYEDGDMEDMKYEACLQAATNYMWQNSQDDEQGKDMIPMVTPSLDGSSSGASSGIITTNLPIPQVTRSSSSITTNNLVPDEVPSSGSNTATTQAINQVLYDSVLDVKIKKEGNANLLSPEELQKRKQCLETWIQTNTDPRTGEGRYVFRRGCAKSCLTQILGGSGIEPFPVVSTPPLIDGKQNPFIKRGEFYVAGNEDFNPWGPRFPGDQGLVNKECFDQLGPQPKQSEFHFFIQCADQPHKRHWHGEDAKGGRMYVGVYRRVAADEVVTPVTFKSVDFDHMNKMAVSDFFARRCRRRGVEIGQRFFVKAQQVVSEQEWEKMSNYQKDKLAMYEKLYEENYMMEIIPVEFVRFDENLYQALVDSGAVISRKGQTGQVSLLVDALHQYL